MHVGVAFWGQNEFTQPEGVVATHARSFAQEGRLYYDLKQYPYTVCVYMPIFYGLVAVLYKLGIPLLLCGRLISILAVMGILYLVWKIVLLYTEDKLCAGTGVALAGITQLLMSWGTVGQVDVLAVSLTLASFYQYSRYHVLGEETLDWAAGFALAGLLTKQTVISAPAAIFVLLALQSPKRALRFAGIVGGIGGAIVWGLNAVLQGNFLANTVFGNLNPMALYKSGQHLRYIAAAMSPLLVVIVIGAPRAIETRMRAAFVYFGFAALVLLATAGKVGSDSNYQIETAILATVCSCFSLHSLQFFPLYYRSSKSLITLLLLPLAVYFVQNVRLTIPSLGARIRNEKLFRTQVKELSQHARTGTGFVRRLQLTCALRTRI